MMCDVTVQGVGFGVEKRRLSLPLKELKLRLEQFNNSSKIMEIGAKKYLSMVVLVWHGKMPMDMPREFSSSFQIKFGVSRKDGWQQKGMITMLGWLYM
jgi:hypothetical protein